MIIGSLIITIISIMLAVYNKTNKWPVPSGLLAKLAKLSYRPEKYSGFI